MRTKTLSEILIAQIRDTTNSLPPSKAQFDHRHRQPSTRYLVGAFATLDIQLG